MGLWGWLGSLWGDSNVSGGSGNQRIYSGAARSSARIPSELPWTRVHPYGLQIDLNILRARSKWLIRNNPYATAAARDIPSLITGATGILPGVDEDVWRDWAEDPRQCHADGRLPLVGLQWLALRAAVSTGDGFIVRRARRSDSAWPLPLQCVVLDGDALAMAATQRTIAPGASVTYGIEFGRRGQRIAYHFRIQRPDGWSEDAIRVDAADVIHIYDPIEPEMQRGVPWFTPTIIALADMGAFNEAALKKADIASKLAAITTTLADPGDGGSARLLPDEDAERDEQLQAPYELPVTPGSEVTIPELPKADSLKDYNEVTLQGVAAGVGTGFRLLTGDFRGMPFSAARLDGATVEMRVRGWRNRLLRPAVRKLWEWGREAARVRGMSWAPASELEWPDPPMQEVEPDKEARAAAFRIRNGLSSLTAELRKRGLVPEQHLGQMAADQALLDSLGLVLDSDPRKMTAQGQEQPSETAEEGSANGGAQGA